MLQKQVNLYPAKGVAGDPATSGQAIYTPVNPVAATDVYAGSFVFPLVTDGVADNSMATSAAGDATGVLGFVERSPIYFNYDVLSDGTLAIPEGSGLTVAVRGDFFAVSSTNASPGQAVLASTADGSVSTGTADATHIDTGWVVKTGGQKGEPIIISNWTTPVLAAAEEEDDDEKQQGGQNG